MAFLVGVVGSIVLARNKATKKSHTDYIVTHPLLSPSLEVFFIREGEFNQRGAVTPLRHPWMEMAQIRCGLIKVSIYQGANLTSTGALSKSAALIKVCGRRWAIAATSRSGMMLSRVL